MNAKPGDLNVAVDSELAERLLELDDGRLRCFKHAANLSRWAFFWTVVLVGIGAVVAAQGAFAKISGSASWLALVFVFLGVLTAAGSAYNAYFKPAARSPEFAAVALDYEAAIFSLQRELANANHDHDPSEPASLTRFDATLSALLASADDALDRIQHAELKLYVTGPAQLKRSLAEREKRAAA